MTSRKFLDIWKGGSAGTIVIPAKAGIQFLFDLLCHWTPTFVGVTDIPPPISNFLWDATLGALLEDGMAENGPEANVLLMFLPSFPLLRLLS